MKPRKITVVDFNENGFHRVTQYYNEIKLKPEHITYPVNLLDPIFDVFFNEIWNEDHFESSTYKSLKSIFFRLRR